jgi:hypothetical protein
MEYLLIDTAGNAWGHFNSLGEAAAGLRATIIGDPQRGRTLALLPMDSDGMPAGDPILAEELQPDPLPAGSVVLATEPIPQEGLVVTESVSAITSSTVADITAVARRRRALAAV